MKPKLVMPPIDPNGSYAKNITNQERCLLVIASLLRYHIVLLDYVATLELERVGHCNLAQLKQPNSCWTDYDGDGGIHVLCRVMAVVTLLQKCLYLLQSIVPDSSELIESPPIHELRLTEPRAQRFSLGALHKTETDLSEIQTTLTKLLAQLRHLYHTACGAPRPSLFTESMDDENRPFPKGDVVVTNAQELQPKSSLKLQPVRLKPKRVECNILTDLDAYLAQEEIFGCQLASRHVHCSGETVGLIEELPADQTKTDTKDRQYPEINVCGVADTSDVTSRDWDVKDERTPTRKCEMFTDDPTNILYLGRNRYASKASTDAFREKKGSATLFDEYETPGPNAYDTIVTRDGPFYTIGTRFPSISPGRTAGYLKVPPMDKWRKRTRQPGISLERRKRLMVMDWYAYQRQQLYFPKVFCHFATDRVKNVVKRYPPDMQYETLANHFPDLAMPRAPPGLPKNVKTLLLP